MKKLIRNYVNMFDTNITAIAFTILFPIAITFIICTIIQIVK